MEKKEDEYRRRHWFPLYLVRMGLDFVSGKLFGVNVYILFRCRLRLTLS